MWRHAGTDAGTVRFELRDQQPLGTRLVLTQTVPPALAEQRATQLAAWQTYLELLFAALHGDVRRPWPRDRTELLRQRYEQRLGEGRVMRPATECAGSGAGRLVHVPPPKPVAGGGITPQQRGHHAA